MEVTTTSKAVSPADAIRGYEAHDLEFILLNLQSVGKPRLHCHDDMLWSCSVNMHVPNAGTTFEVRSEFNMVSPLAAARQCAERVLKTLSQFQ